MALFVLVGCVHKLKKVTFLFTLVTLGTESAAPEREYPS